MLKDNLFTRFFLLFALAEILIFSSCVTTKDTVYFSDLSDSIKFQEIIPAQFKEPVIQRDDILAITIQTLDSNFPGIDNSTLTTNPAAFNNQMGQGYLVDEEGNIALQMLGKIKVAGLTTAKARELIRSRAALYLKEPIVQLRFLNYKITVIGEVARPSIYTIPNEKISLLDALGYAGDLTIYGRRENVLLIRDNDGKKELVRLNLNSTDIFKSPYFYLRQNDVIYVEPNPSKVASSDAVKTRTITIAASLASALLVVLIRIL